MKLYRKVLELRVTSCRGCPNWHAYLTQGGTCKLTQTVTNLSGTDTNGDTLPTWCPLPDAVLEAQGAP